MKRTATAESHLSWDHCHLLDIDSVCVPCVITSVNLCGLHHELIMLSESWKKKVAIIFLAMTVILNLMALSYLAMCDHLQSYSGSFPSRISATDVLFFNINHSEDSDKHQAWLSMVGVTTGNSTSVQVLELSWKNIRTWLNDKCPLAFWCCQFKPPLGRRQRDPHADCSVSKKA